MYITYGRAPPSTTRALTPQTQPYGAGLRHGFAAGARRRALAGTRLTASTCGEGAGISRRPGARPSPPPSSIPLHPPSSAPVLRCPGAGPTSASRRRRAAGPGCAAASSPSARAVRSAPSIPAALRSLPPYPVSRLRFASPLLFPAPVPAPPPGGRPRPAPAPAEGLGSAGGTPKRWVLLPPHARLLPVREKRSLVRSPSSFPSGAVPLRSAALSRTPYPYGFATERTGRRAQGEGKAVDKGPVGASGRHNPTSGLGERLGEPPRGLPPTGSRLAPT